jgi:acetolactate synthase-1/2/3 large subunit
MHQERSFPGRVSGTALTNPDFAKFIESFSGHGEVVSETAAFAPAFERAVASGRPALIELRTDPEQITTRTTLTALRGGKAPAAAGIKPKRTPAPKHPKPVGRAKPGGKRA